MATGFRKNTPPRSHLDTTIQMLLGTPLNKGPHPKRCMKSSPHHSFRQVHRGRPSDNDKFCMDLFLQAQASRPEPAGHREGPREVFVPPRYDQLSLALAQALEPDSRRSLALG